MARKIPEINAGSMADIAFLLLIFFLVTTTMDVDTGLMRRLPPPPKKNEKTEVDINKRNVFMVLINKDNVLAINGNPAEVGELRPRIKEFILNANDDPNLSEKELIADKLKIELSKKEPDQEKVNLYKEIIKEFGDGAYVSKGIVSLQNDRGTTYGKYIEVQNEIVGAFNDLRDNMAKKKWGKPYDKLDENQQKMIKTMIPMSISEAEPRSLAKK